MGGVGAPFPDPPPFRALVAQTPAGPPGEVGAMKQGIPSSRIPPCHRHMVIATSRGRLGGGRGGSEVPQQVWLKTIPHDALIILRYVSWGNFFLKKNSSLVAQVVIHHQRFQTSLFGLAYHESPFRNPHPPFPSKGSNDPPPPRPP